jgi:hypothetical protein
MYVIRNHSHAGFSWGRFSVDVFHYIPGKKIVFVRLNFVFGIQKFLPSRRFISSVNKFPAKILGLWAYFCVK